MTVPAAPLSGGDKMIFLVFDAAGTLTPALLRGIASATLDAETVAHLGIASHADGDTHGAGAPLVLIGGSDGTLARKILIDAAGRVVTTGPADVFKSVAATVITSETTIWTPTSGKKFRFRGFALTQGVATGNITVKDGSGGSTILTIPATPTGQPLVVDLGRGILSAAANNLLRMIGVSTETISGFVYGNEE
jgi:hypothetical protein